MLTRRTVILVAAFLVAAFGAASTPLALSMGATAADASALAFVTDIYSAYNGKDAKGHPLDDERAIRRYFEPSLAALMVKDQKIAAKRGEVGLLDFDPFIDAQDWEISNIDIAVADGAPGNATATVKLKEEAPNAKMKEIWRGYARKALEVIHAGGFGADAATRLKIVGHSLAVAVQEMSIV